MCRASRCGLHTRMHTLCSAAHCVALQQGLEHSCLRVGCFCAYTHEHVRQCLCLPCHGVHTLHWDCSVTVQQYVQRSGPSTAVLSCNPAAQGRPALQAGGWRFPVLPVQLGVNTGVKRWVTSQRCSPQISDSRDSAPAFCIGRQKLD